MNNWYDSVGDGKCHTQNTEKERAKWNGIKLTKTLLKSCDGSKIKDGQKRLPLNKWRGWKEWKNTATPNLEQHEKSLDPSFMKTKTIACTKRMEIKQKENTHNSSNC